jgi:hypothetical protein
MAKNRSRAEDLVKAGRQLGQAEMLHRWGLASVNADCVCC